MSIKRRSVSSERCDLLQLDVMDSSAAWTPGHAKGGCLAAEQYIYEHLRATRGSLGCITTFQPVLFSALFCLVPTLVGYLGSAEMNRWQWFALLFGVLLLTAPLIKAEEEDYEDDHDEEGAAAAPAGDDEKDVLVITQDNFDDKVKKGKFALVG